MEAQPNRKSEAPTSQRTKKALLGPGCNAKRRARLLEVLTELGAEVVDHQWGVVGLVEAETLRVRVANAELFVESWSDECLSIFGPAELVDEVKKMLRRRR